MSLTHLRAGVIGTGFIGPVHIEALKRLGIQVVAVCDTDANAAAAAERFGIPNAIGGLQYQRLVGHPEVDVVHVASPNRLHAEHSLAALGRRQARGLREAAGDDQRRDREDRRGGEEEPARVRGELQPALLRRAADAARDGRRRPVRAHHPRQRQLLPGLAVPRHRLQLAAAAEGRRQAPRAGRHRHALDGRGLVHPRRPRRRGLRRSRHPPQEAPAPAGRGQDVQRQDRGRPLAELQGRDRGLRVGAAALRGWRARHACRCRRWRPGARTSCGWRSTARSSRRGGTPSRPSN